MSYIGIGTIGSHVAHESASPDDTGMVAARDITRLNGIGQTVIVVPAGQPIPAGMEVEPGEATVAPEREDTHVRGYVPRPEVMLTARDRQNLFSERALSLLRRRP